MTRVLTKNKSIQVMKAQEKYEEYTDWLGSMDIGVSWSLMSY